MSLLEPLKKGKLQPGRGVAMDSSTPLYPVSRNLGAPWIPLQPPWCCLCCQRRMIIAGLFCVAGLSLETAGSSFFASSAVSQPALPSDVSCDVSSLRNLFPALPLLTTSASLLVQLAMSSSISPLFPGLSTFDILEADSVCQVCL